MATKKRVGDTAKRRRSDGDQPGAGEKRPAPHRADRASSREPLGNASRASHNGASSSIAESDYFVAGSDRIAAIERVADAAFELLLQVIAEVDREWSGRIADLRSRNQNDAAHFAESERSRRFGQLDHQFRSDARLLFRTICDAALDGRSEHVASLAKQRQRGRTTDWLDSCAHFVEIMPHWLALTNDDAQRSAVERRCALLAVELMRIHPIEATERKLTAETVHAAWIRLHDRRGRADLSLAATLVCACGAFGEKSYRDARQLFASLKAPKKRDAASSQK